jgi:CYTH domain-containing protein
VDARAGEPLAEPVRAGKYALVERERRFLLAGAPAAGITGRRRITDRYVRGTRLRLRRAEDPGSGTLELKLAQKVPAGRPGHVQGLITNTYLSAAEYDVLAALPGDVLAKTRLRVPPLSVDVFDPPLHGLVIGEAEFATDETALAFPVPPGTVAEITDDRRLTGGSLARAGRADLVAWLADYGIRLPAG